MSSHKRASMREGPLAALFRRTEDDEQAGQAQDPSSYEQETAGLARDAAGTPGVPAAGAEVSAGAGASDDAEASDRARAGDGAPGARGGASADSAAVPRAGRDTRSASTAARSTRPKDRSASSEDRSASSEDRSASTEDRSASSEARSAGPEAGSVSREYRSAGPKARSARAGARGAASHVPEPAAEPATPAGAIRAPKDRLKQAFSSEIPASLMESEGHVRRSARPPAVEYADEQTAFGSTPDGQPIIRVVGVGGAGVNAVNRMVQAEVEGVEFLAVNTDQQSLQHSTADITLHIGATVTRGLGSGSDAAVGRQAAMEDYDRAKALLKGSDMIFITAGAGGGTGSGAAPIIARIAGEVGALTVAIVTKPFSFEGSRRSEQAEKGVAALAEEVDTLIVVPNDRLLSVLDKQTAMVEAFRVADDVLRQGVQGISDLVTLPGLINLDFADVRTIMSDAGSALLGIGMGAGGEQRAIEAATQAVASPLLETSMDGARSILLSITGGRDLSLWEVNEAAKAVSEAAHPDANIIFGAMIDEKLDDQVWVTVVATGYSDAKRVVARDAGDLREPAGEPRVRRTAPARPRGARRTSLSVEDLDVPEFIPR